jgi:hypothetical protein
VLADILFRDRPVGVNAGLFAAASVVTLALILRVGRTPASQGGRRFMVVPLLVLAGLLAWHDSPLLLAANLSRLRAGPTELAVAIGAVDLHFLGFVLVQVRYLFGGAGLVEPRTGLTYAEYAQHGFSELAVVALLVLPVILGAHACCATAARAWCGRCREP